MGCSYSNPNLGFERGFKSPHLRDLFLFGNKKNNNDENVEERKSKRFSSLFSLNFSDELAIPLENDTIESSDDEYDEDILEDGDENEYNEDEEEGEMIRKSALSKSVKSLDKRNVSKEPKNADRRLRHIEKAINKAAKKAKEKSIAKKKEENEKKEKKKFFGLKFPSSSNTSNSNNNDKEISINIDQDIEDNKEVKKERQRGPPVPSRCVGYLKKQGGNFKTWKTRFFILEKGILTYYKAETTPGSNEGSEEKGKIFLSGALEEKIEFTDEKKGELLLTSTERKLPLIVENLYLAQAWLESITEHIDYVRKVKELEAISENAIDLNTEL